jgi:hypothetical protein
MKHTCTRARRRDGKVVACGLPGTAWYEARWGRQKTIVRCERHKPPKVPHNAVRELTRDEVVVMDVMDR